MQRRHLTGAGLLLTGLALAAIQALHALEQTDVPVAVAVDGLPFVAMGLGVAFAGGWAWRAAEYDADVARIGGWCLAGMVALAAVAALVLFGQQVTTGALTRAAYLTMDLLTVGAIGGVLVGLYDVQSRKRRDALERERDRIERFAGKAADVNNYGRAIYSAESADGVAAYVVEAVATLVDLQETAVLTIADGSTVADGPTPDAEDAAANDGAAGESHAIVLASTITSIDRDALAPLASVALDQRPRDVVVYDRGDLPPSVPAGVTQAVAVLVTEQDGGATVVLALGGPDATVAETDRELLELVASHAAATLRRLAPTGERHTAES